MPITVGYQPNIAAGGQLAYQAGRGRFLQEQDRYNEGIRQYDTTLNEGARRFDETLDENQRQYDTTFGEGVRQYDQNFGEGVRRYDTTFDEGVRQYDTTFGEGVRQYDQNFGEGQRQYDSTLAFKGRQLNVQDRQFNRKLGQDAYQFGAGLESNERQFSQQFGLDQRREDRLGQYGDEQLSLQRETMELRDAQLRRADISGIKEREEARAYGASMSSFENLEQARGGLTPQEYEQAKDQWVDKFGHQTVHAGAYPSDLPGAAGNQRTSLAAMGDQFIAMGTHNGEQLRTRDEMFQYGQEDGNGNFKYDHDGRKRLSHDNLELVKQRDANTRADQALANTQAEAVAKRERERRDKDAVRRQKEIDDKLKRHDDLRKEANKPIPAVGEDQRSGTLRNRSDPEKRAYIDEGMRHYYGPDWKNPPPPPPPTASEWLGNAAGGALDAAGNWLGGLVGGAQSQQSSQTQPPPQSRPAQSQQSSQTQPPPQSQQPYQRPRDEDIRRVPAGREYDTPVGVPYFKERHAIGDPLMNLRYTNSDGVEMQFNVRVDMETGKPRDLKNHPDIFRRKVVGSVSLFKGKWYRHVDADGGLEEISVPTSQY